MDEILFRKATNSDVEEISQLMETVYRQLEDPSIFACDDMEYVKNHIQKEGFCIVAQNQNEKIVGVLMVRFPFEAEDNLGIDIHLPKEKLNQVAHMESCVVHPDYRGHRLQQQLLQLAEEWIDKENFSYLLATVAPHNIPSRHSLEKVGYHFILQKKKYGGLDRALWGRSFCHEERPFVMRSAPLSGCGNDKTVNG